MVSTVNIKGRNRPFFGAGVEIKDESGPYLRHLADTFPREFNRALRHIGWWMRKEIQDAVYRGGPASARWPRLSQIHAGRALDDAKFEMGRGKRKPPATHPYGRLVHAIGYRHNPAGMSVRIGWLSRSAAQQASKLQKGERIQVTEKMRRFYWAAGVPLSSSTAQINVPARELISPMHREKRLEIQQRIEKRILRNLRPGRGSRFNFLKQVTRIAA